MNGYSTRSRWLIWGAALVVSACAEPAPEIRPMEVSGAVAAPPGLTGPVEVRLYHAWSLSGKLRHPLQFIDAFEIDGSSFTHRFDYPVEVGEGLIVYAWMDTDGDGVLCTPTDREDIAGLTEVADADAERVDVVVELTANCRGPDWFYPPRPAG
jgi:hypothetical protein